MPTATIDGKSCFYRDEGQGFPLLLGHSYLWSSSMWEPQLQELSREFRCIAPDLWSHGNSSNLQEEITLETLADHGYKLMESLGISEFAVIGLSIGGMWGARLALKYPEAVKALVLMDTFLGSEPEITQKKYFALLDALEKNKGFSPTLLDQIIPLFFSPFTAFKNPKLIHDFRESLASLKEDKIKGVCSIGRMIFSRPCFLENLSKLSQPTLLLVGKDDIPRPPKESEEMLSFLKQGEMKVIELAGHISNLEQPEIVTSALENFITKNALVPSN